MIRKILVALDGSDRSADVLTTATEIAERFDAELFLFRTVTIPPDFPPAAHVPTGDPLPPFLLNQARTALEEIARGNPRASAHAPIVAVGRPWKTICTASDDLDVDLIVIGSHGYGGWDRVLGTNAARVVDRAGRSVLVVHPVAAKGRAREHVT